MTAPIHDGPGLITRRLRVAKHEVAWLRYVVEAHGHLANVHVAKGGVVTLVAPADRAALLDGVLADLEREITVERLGAPA